MGKICKNCQKEFEITEQDLAFYAKVEVPSPTHCPDCRLQRRMAFRNENTLYKRKCDLCNKDVISTFDVNRSFPVYCMDCWWSDNWDPFAYGQDIDFTRPFFDQLGELLARVPKSAFLQLASENCEYNALIAYSKNTYMSPGSHFMQDSIYCRKSQYCKDCLDSNLIDHCELTGFSTNSKNCYACHHIINSRSCVDSAYLKDCANCKNCFMCSGLVGKSFCIKNQQYSEEDYKKYLGLSTQKAEEEVMNEFLNFDLQIPKRPLNMANCENSIGDYLYNSKSAIEAYDSIAIEDSKYIFESESVKSSMDLLCHDKDIENCYEQSSGGDRNVNVKFSFCPVNCSNSAYLYACFYLMDSFGCDGFHSRQENVILNKKYDKATYESLKNRLVEYMKQTGEWGEFPSIKIAPNAYNETMANEYFPLTREQALQKGYTWKDQEEKLNVPATGEIKNSILETGDEVVNQIFACKKCGKNYKVLSQEIALHKKIGVALSAFCPSCRQMNLMALKNPRKLFDRNCAICNAEIQTTYAPDSLYKVLCEPCYLKTIY
ncbi:MAG: zinc-ribbon domain containing protein [Candidatus Gracilibacteria bacterium]